MAHRTAQAKEHHGGNYIAGGTQGSKSVLDLAAHTTLKKRRVVATPTSTSTPPIAPSVPAIPSDAVPMERIDTSDEDDDDEDALQAEIEALRKAKLEARNKTVSAPVAAAAPPPSSVVQQPLWMDDGMFRGNATKASLQEGTASAPPNRFINDPLHNDFHKRFMDKLFK